MFRKSSGTEKCHVGTRQKGSLAATVRYVTYLSGRRSTEKHQSQPCRRLPPDAIYPDLPSVWCSRSSRTRAAVYRVLSVCLFCPPYRMPSGDKSFSPISLRKAQHLLPSRQPIAHWALPFQGREREFPQARMLASSLEIALISCAGLATGRLRLQAVDGSRWYSRYHPNHSI